MAKKDRQSLKSMFEIIREKSLPSTNTYALELLNNKRISKPTVVVADAQIKGRGQAQNQWFSEEGKSLTFSVVLFPERIKAERQFTLSQVICLAVCNTLAQYVENVNIKWPNDIYINGKKTCGILIENAVLGEGLAYSVCGVGLNVNNANFSSGYVATSLHSETGCIFDLENILEQILKKIELYYLKAEKEEYALLNSWYHECLYKIGETIRFEDKQGVFMAKVIGIDQYGQLLVEDDESQLRTYGFKEVAWLL